MVRSTDRAHPVASAAYSLVGLWQSDVIEHGKLTRITWDIRSDGTTAYVFQTADQRKYLSGTWRFADGVIYEGGTNGGSSGAIKWTASNQFEVTIIDNGDPVEKGLVRTYHRVL
jgi:hypothetical protein